jgi:hypothetical protein
MTWKTVRSRRIDKVRYDAEHQTLDVRFKSGRQVTHIGIPHHTYEALLHPDTDAGFYYRYFIADGRSPVTSKWIRKGSRFAKIVPLTAAAWFASCAIF